MRSRSGIVVGLPTVGFFPLAAVPDGVLSTPLVSLNDGDRQMETLAQDLRYGIRMLNRNPGFSLMVVVILALGIGANSAMFTLINGVLLAPLPYKGADRLVAVNENRPSLKKHDSMVSGPEFTAWTERNTVFDHTAAISY